MDKSTQYISKIRKFPKVLDKAHPKEIAFAEELADKGFDVVVKGKHAKGADLLINGVEFELKTLESATINAVRQNLRKGLKQSSRVIIDGRQAGLSYGSAIRALRQHQAAGRLGAAQEIRILTQSGEVVWTP